MGVRGEGTGRGHGVGRGVRRDHGYPLGRGAPVMKVFEFNGHGLALGSVLVVVAEDEARAWKMAEERALAELESWGLDKIDLRLVRTADFDREGVVHVWDGDY